MPDNYTEKIFKEYIKRKNAENLPPALLWPTPGGLRDECKRAYIDKGLPTDVVALRSFFGPLGSEENYLRRIEGFDIDLFKPLVGFLKNKVINPSRKNVELLEWLMDAHPIKTRTCKKKFQKCIATKSKSLVLKQIFILTTIFLLLEALVYFAWQNYSERISLPKADEQCMFWTGNHYEPINCKKRIDGVPVIPLDKKKLNSLIRINLPDTLTEKSLGKVWYSGFGKAEHEFFTDSGMHPVDTVKRLRKLTPYILMKHVSYQRHIIYVLIGSGISIVFAIALAAGIIFIRSRFMNRKLTR